MIRRLSLLGLELTNSCNFACQFCASRLMGRKKGFMDTQLAKRLIREVKETRFCDTVVTNVMGEPLLHPDLFDILDYAKTLGQKMTVITNGALLNEERSLALWRCEPLDIGISYHASDDASVRLRTGSLTYAEYRDRMFRFIEQKFASGNSATQVNIFALSTFKRPHDQFGLLETREAIGRFWDEWHDFAARMKRQYRLRWWIPTDIYWGINHILPAVNLWLEAEYHTWSGAILPGTMSVLEAERVWCRVPFWQCNVLWNGDLTLCCIDQDGELTCGSVCGRSLRDAYNAPEARAMRRLVSGRGAPPAKCARCQGRLLDPAGVWAGVQGTPYDGGPPIYKLHRLYGLLRNRVMTGYVAEKAKPLRIAVNRYLRDR